MMFNTSKIGNLTTIDSKNDSQVKVLSIILDESQQSPNKQSSQYSNESPSTSPLTRSYKQRRMQNLANEASRLKKKSMIDKNSQKFSTSVKKSPKFSQSPERRQTVTSTTSSKDK